MNSQLISPALRVISWNMLFNNGRLDEALAFVRDSGADIFCLQEVPEAFLTELKSLSYELAYRTDMVKFFSSGAMPTYNVTLSKYPILRRGDILHPEYWEHIPLRTRVFIYFMRPFFFSKVVERGGMYVDMSVLGRTIRIFNLHLILGPPAWRLAELEAAMLCRDPALPTIVCGDFNVLESPRVTILNWLGGGRLSDALLWRRERTRMERRFSGWGLSNPLRGNSTHPLSRSQLDHILISKEFTSKDARVEQNRFGSDHHPIAVALDYI